MKLPLVSVIIPFFNNFYWLSEAIDSVLNQTYKNLEIIIINDGSNIDISSIITSDNIKIYSQENKGPGAARNLGILNSKGEYIAFLDSDDIWNKDKISLQILKMLEDDLVWSQHSYLMFWENSNRTKIVNTSSYKGNVFIKSFISFKIQTSCVMVKKSILIDNNIFFPINKRYGQDGVFFKKIAQLYNLGYINGILSKFRIRGNNAGFRAYVQLMDKYESYIDLKSNLNILSVLPYRSILAFRICYINFKFLSFMLIYFKINNISIEYISKILYLFPYILLKSIKLK